jgi:hypothetical protein
VRAHTHHAGLADQTLQLQHRQRRGDQRDGQVALAAQLIAMLRLVADQLEQRGLGQIVGEGGLHLLLDGGRAEVECLQNMLNLRDPSCAIGTINSGC